MLLYIRWGGITECSPCYSDALHSAIYLLHSLLVMVSFSSPAIQYPLQFLAAVVVMLNITFLVRTLHGCAQELMSGEATKERVTPVPSRSKLLTYFRFESAQCASCSLRCKGSDAFKGLLRAFLVGFKTTTFVLMARLNGELFICCIRTCLGDTCCNWSLRFEIEGVSKR